MAEVVEESKPKPKNRRDFKKKIGDVIYTIRPILLLEYVYGIYRFNFVNGDVQLFNWKIKTFGVFLVAIVLTIFITYLMFPAVISTPRNLVEIINEIPSIVVFIQHTTATMTVLFLVNTANIDIITKLAKIDTILQVEKSSDFYKKSRIQTYRYLSVVCASHVIISILYLMYTEENTVNDLFLFLIYLVQKLEVMAFCKYISMVISRLRIINNYLKISIQDQEKKNIIVFTVSDRKIEKVEEFNFIGLTSESNTKIRELAKMYDIIGKVCSMINKVFNHQIFMTLVSAFTYVVITIWTSLYYYKSPETSSGELVNMALWSFSAIYTIAVMSIACERLLLVRNETKVLVNEIIMNYDLPKTMRVQAKTFMELVEAWPLRIYVYDMFSVDITLMLKFISVATTYLIVITQISHFV